MLIHSVSKTLAQLSKFFIALGPLGLFVVALLDSTFVPLPSSADALMLLLSAAHPRWMIVYALVATAGSAIGCGILYSISRRAGTRALSKFSPAKQQRVKTLIDRYDFIAVLVATVLPPPFPFKLFVVTAGVFRFSLSRFMIAVISGRAFRFLLEGYFAVRYGVQAKAVLAKYYPWIGLTVIALLVVIFVIRGFWRSREEQAVEQPLETGR